MHWIIEITAIKAEGSFILRMGECTICRVVLIFLGLMVLVEFNCHSAKPSRWKDKMIQLEIDDCSPWATWLK
jgi:hypothetical protein